MSLFSFHDSIIRIFEVDALLCRLSFLALADTPCNVEREPIAAIFVEADGMLVKVAVENLRLVLLVSWCERTHPCQLELPVVQFVGYLQGSDAPTVSLVFAFKKAIAVVSHCHKGDLAEVCHYVAGLEPRCVTVGVVVAKVETAIQTAVCCNL